MLGNTASKCTIWKEMFLEKDTLELWILKDCQNHWYVCKHTRAFQVFWEILAKETRNVKYITKTLLFGKLKL